MERREAINRLRAHEAELKQLGVQHLAVVLAPLTASAATSRSLLVRPRAASSLPRP